MSGDGISFVSEGPIICQDTCEQLLRKLTDNAALIKVVLTTWSRSQIIHQTILIVNRNEAISFADLSVQWWHTVLNKLQTATAGKFPQ